MVNVGQRRVADTAVNNQCYAVEAALTLLLHTLNKCNSTRFQENEQFTKRIEDTAVELYLSAFAANDVRVKTAKDWTDRDLAQKYSIKLCKRMRALINAAKRLNKLRRKETEYWIRMTKDTENLLIRWHEANAKEYKNT